MQAGRHPLEGIVTNEPVEVPWVFEPATGRREPRVLWEAARRRKLLGFQRVCPRCGAGIGEPCVSSGGVPRRYVTMSDLGHHREQAS